MNSISPPIVAATLVFTTASAFCAGFLIAAPASQAAHAATAVDPIVDPLAWEVSAPPPAPTCPRTPAPQCSPWEVSDVAMEAVLDEMQRRGWRPPQQVEEVLAEVNLASDWRAGAIPGASAPDGAITVVSDEDANRLWSQTDRAPPQPVQPASLTTAY